MLIAILMILLTGSSGFLGKEIITSFQRQKKAFVSVGRSSINLIQCDLSNQIPEIPSIDMAVHTAGKAHIVPKNAKESYDFFTVNVKGTQNLLTALENNQSLRKFVFISSVAVYGLTKGEMINEGSFKEILNEFNTLITTLMSY